MQKKSVQADTSTRHRQAGKQVQSQPVAVGGSSNRNSTAFSRKRKRPEPMHSHEKPYVLLDKAYLQSRPEVNSLLMLLVIGINDTDNFSSNLSVLCSSLKSMSYSSSFFEESSNDFNCLFALQQDSALSLGADVQNMCNLISRTSRLRCLNYFVYLVSHVKFALKVFS